MPMLALRKMVYRASRLISSGRRWFLRRFTNTGRAVLAAMLVTATIGFDTEQTNTYQVFSLLAALLFVASVASWRKPRGLAVNRRLPRFATAGHPVEYTIELENQTGKFQKGLVVIEDLADPRPSFAEYVATQIAYEKSLPFFSVESPRKPNRPIARGKEMPVPAILPRGRAEVKMAVCPQRRGMLRFDGVTIGKPDPLGLLKGLRSLPNPQNLMVLPRRYYVSPVALPGSMKYQQGGVALASSVGESEEFVALRDYRPGDALRHIHWRSWAKMGKPVVKEFQEEFFVRHALILDTFSPWAKEELLEDAVSVAASFACTIQTQESLLDLMFVGPQAYCFTTGRGLAHTDQMLEILAVVQACRDKGFDALERLVMQHLSTVSGCIVILLEWDEARRNLVRKLQAIGLPLLILVITEPGRASALEASSGAGGVNFHALESGRIGESLAKIWS